MAPVVRVSDDVFRRLQAISEPLVDTPSRVIERLLTHYETRGPQGHQSPKNSRGIPSPREAALEAERTEVGVVPNLFLAPARVENLRQSLDRSVRLDFARQFLSEEQFSDLSARLAGRTEFHCWAASEGKLAYFEAMRPNDYVVFAETGTGRLRYVARTVTRLVSERLGEALWPVVPGLPWKYIYVLDRVRRVDMPKEPFLKKLGYEWNYPIYGFIRVTPRRVREVLADMGSIEALLASSTEDPRKH